MTADRIVSLDVELGARYRDPVSGWEGVATSCDIWLYGCQRVRLEGSDKDGRPESFMFDAPQLERLDAPSIAPSALARTGGPRGTTRA